MIELKCTSCGQTLRVSDDNAGKRGRCSQCQTPIEIPVVAASTDSTEPGRRAEQEASSVVLSSSDQAGSRNELESLQSANAKATQARNIHPASESQTYPNSTPGENALDNDNIPVATPANDRPFWQKAAIVSAAILAVSTVVLVIALSWNSTQPDRPIYRKALKLNEEARDLVRPVKHILDGVEPARLFDWKNLVKESTGKFSEILDLEAENAEEIKLLAAAQKDAKRENNSASERVADIENELWPLVTPDDRIQEMFPRVSSAIPIVQTTRGRGSGFLLEHDRKLWIATNRHVIENTDKNGLELVFMLGDPSNPNRSSVSISRTAAIGAVYKHSDLAIIRLPDLPWFKDLISKKQIRPIKLHPPNRQPKTADKIWTVGHPGQHIPLTVTQGAISGIKDNYSYMDHDFGKVIQIDAEITHGSSGGPVFDRHGRVVGIATLGIPTRDGKRVKYAVHVNELWKLLTDPDSSFTLEEMERIIKVAATCKLHRMTMRRNGWLQCGSLNGKSTPERDNANERWINYRIGGFEAMARTQYAVTVVSDPQHEIELLVAYPKGVPGPDGKRQPEVKQAVGSGILRINLELKDRADVIIKVLDPSDSKKDWPVHVDVFRRVSPATAPKRN
jgi:S1-C subfamily serine protease